MDRGDLGVRAAAVLVRLSERVEQEFSETEFNGRRRWQIACKQLGGGATERLHACFGDSFILSEPGLSHWTVVQEISEGLQHTISAAMST